MNVSEYDIVQNSALGGLIIWSFAQEYFETTYKQKGPTILLTLPVLPMVFHKETCKSIFKRDYEGGLFRALSEDRTLSVGLQNRITAMTSQTFEALDLAFSAKLIRYEKANKEIIPLRKTPPHQVLVGEIREMLAAARRLGHWFADLGTEHICVLLGVVF